MRMVLRTATAIVNDSQAMREYYLRQFNRDSYFIAYGAEIHVSTRPDVLTAYGVRPGEYYLIASRLIPENNADLIISAFTKTASRRQLVVAGAANYRDAWVDAVRATSDPRVHFLGHVPDPDHMLELHANCYAYLHGHSLGGTNPALLKALGCGNCVVALDTTFNREVLVSEAGTAYGLLFPKDVDALAAMIDDLDRDDARASRLRARGPNRIREAYTWDSIADKYERMFEAVLRDGKPGTRLP